MYTFFDQAGRGTQRALAVAGSLIVTVFLMASANVPTGPFVPLFTGVLA